MYSFLVGRIKPADDYDWFKYAGREPIQLDYRGKPVTISKGVVFGVRPSSNGKFIRLVLQDDVNRVITIPMEVAQKLAKKVKLVDS